MESIVIKSSQEFESIISKIDTKVGSRKDKRDQDTKEFFSLVNFLRRKNENGALTFPLLIKKRQSPDFELVEGDETYGIEIAELTNELYQALLSYCDCNPGYTFEPSMIRYGMTPQNTNWREFLKKIDEPLEGGCLYGNEPEIYSAQWGRDEIIKKIPKLVEYKKKFPGKLNILLYDNSPYWFIDYKVFSQLLKEYSALLLEENKEIINQVSYLSSDGKVAILDVRLGEKSLIGIID